MRRAVILAVSGAVLSLPAAAYEPDVTQQRSEAVADPPDRLMPDVRLEETGGYIARYERVPSFHPRWEWQIVRNDDKYTLSSWRVQSSPRDGISRQESIELEITQEMSAAVYAIWATAILNAKFSRNGGGLDGTNYFFSTCLRSVGCHRASAWSPGADLPPTWIVEAGNEVLDFSRGKDADADAVLHRLESIKQRMEAYYEGAESNCSC